MPLQHLIVGTGPAGVIAAETLRALDPSARIVMIGREPGPPYSRMAIPYLLGGAIDENGTALRARADHFDQLDIQLRQGVVVDLSLADQRLALHDGELIPFDTLLIATGSSPSPPAVEGHDQPGVHSCWTLSDARRIAELARPGAKVVLIGAGFIACIIMKALVDRGVDLTVLMGRSGRMVRSMLCPEAGDLLRKRCEAAGVRVITGARVSAFEAGPALQLDGGQSIPADLIVTATGVEANTRWLEDCLDIDRGVKVDRCLRSSCENIYAAGDVAQGPALGSDELEVHPIHPTAAEEGRVAALNMTGRSVPYRGSLRMNVLNTMDLISASLGQWRGVTGGERIESRVDHGSRFLRLELDGDRLVGANVIGEPAHIGALRGLIQIGLPLGSWKAKLRQNPWRFMEALIACQR